MKRKNNDKKWNGITALIRNLDASLIYKLSVEQNERKVIIDNYINLYCEKRSISKELNSIINEANEKKEEPPKDVIRTLNSKLYNKDIELKNYIKDNSIYQMNENMSCKLKGEHNRFYYKGNLTDSLMRRELINILNKKDKFTGTKNCGFCDSIINISFSTDYMVKKLTQSGTSNYETVISANELRNIFCRDGVWINGIHYVDFERSSSKARTGDCLYIDEKYLKKMISWIRMGLNFNREIYNKKGTSYKKPRYIDIDIVGARAYESLTSSTITGTVKINPYNILLIDDISGKYTMKCNVVKSEVNKWKEIDKDKKEIEKTETLLKVSAENYTQQTDLWDGQSLIDESIFKQSEFSDKGFLLLRNHFLKTAGFNTKLRAFLQSEEINKKLVTNHNGEKCTKDRFGNLIPAKQIQMVTTKNSIKIFKEPFISCILFDELELTVEKVNEMEQIEKESLVWNWYREKLYRMMDNTMGVCKYEKVSKFEQGVYQQLSYQMINSLNFTKAELEELAKPQFTEIELIKNHAPFFKHIIGTPKMSNAKQSMMMALLEVNDKVQGTKLYKDYKNERIKRLKERIERGKILIKNSDNCVLFGNPYEMLLASVGLLETEDGIAMSSIMGTVEQVEKNQFECYCKKFDDKEELFGFRSPHICESNSTLFVNVNHPEYRWFNMTNNIIAVSFFGYGAFLNPKLNG